MKSALLLFFCLLKATLFALYQGNPSSPSMIEEGIFFSKENALAAKAGYQRDYVFNRGMKAVSKVSRRLDSFSYIADRGVLALNLIDRFELYGFAGAAQFKLSHIPMSGIRNEYETDNQLIWGMGARGVIFSWERATLGIGIGYERAKPALRWVTTNGAPLQETRGSGLVFYEWQTGIGLAYQIDIFSPYLVVKYSSANGRLKQLPTQLFPETRHFSMKNRRKFGLILGLSLSSGQCFKTTLEMRLIDEQAMTFAGEIEF